MEAQKVSLIEGELVVACQTRDAVEMKLPSLVDRAADVDR
jgi:hypothetical protein